MYQNFGVLHLVVTGLLGWLIGGNLEEGKKYGKENRLKKHIVVKPQKPVGVLCVFAKIASTLIFECFFFGSDL